MQIRNATELEIKKALRKVNKKMDPKNSNVQFNRFDYLGKTRQGGDKFSLTLRVKSSKGIGARRALDGHRLVAACWHVHGHFFDALPAKAEIITGRMRIKPGQAWQDFEVGSLMNPHMLSELCECGK